MITHRVPSPEGAALDWVFLTCTFLHRGTAYRAAVAQNSHVAEADAGYLGHNYHVLLQSEETFYNFTMWKGEEELWECDEPFVLQEIIFLLGNEITEG